MCFPWGHYPSLVCSSLGAREGVNESAGPYHHLAPLLVEYIMNQFDWLLIGVESSRHVIPEPVTNILMNNELFWDYPHLLPTTGFSEYKC